MGWQQSGPVESQSSPEYKKLIVPDQFNSEFQSENTKKVWYASGIQCFSFNKNIIQQLIVINNPINICKERERNIHIQYTLYIVHTYRSQIQ